MRIGIDLGGTKIEGVVLDEAGQIVARQRRATPRGHYGPILDAVLDLVLQLEDEVKASCTVGIGTPGALSPATGLLRNSNSVELNGHPIKHDLETLLKREVRIANDANCFALSEAVDGAAAGAAVVFGVIVGTGTGAGVAINRQVLAGVNAIAGEWGHNPLPWMREDEFPGEECYCGKLGCVETFLSGPGMARDYMALAGKALKAEAIVTCADGGDEIAGLVLRRYEERMARALAHVINILDPDVIVLGGGLSNIQRLYATVPPLLSNYVFSDVVRTRLVPPSHGDSSGVRGAAWLWEKRG